MKLFSITSLEERNFLPVSRAFAMFGIKDHSQCVKCVRGNGLEIYESRSGRSCFSICSQNNRRFDRSCPRKKKLLENENRSLLVVIFQALSSPVSCMER